MSSAIFRDRLMGLGVFAVILILCFAQPLATLARVCAVSELYRHVLVMPAISLFLVWQARDRIWASFEAPKFGKVGVILFGLIGGLLARYVAAHAGLDERVEDSLALTTSLFLLLLLAGGFMFLGRAAMRAAAWPMSFLAFCIPLPLMARSVVDGFLQQGSAWAAETVLNAAGTPVLRDELVLQVPGIALRVAEECSGVHSSLVLLITTLLAGRMFLINGWSRWILALIVVPLAVFRNGLRIATIGFMCAHAGPEMIDSAIHRKGGPVFFVLSLIPCWLVLLGLRRAERGAGPKQAS